MCYPGNTHCVNTYYCSGQNEGREASETCTISRAHRLSKLCEMRSVQHSRYGQEEEGVEAPVEGLAEEEDNLFSRTSLGHQTWNCNFDWEANRQLQE